MKRILSLIICMAIVISSVGVVTFADANHWSYDFIKGMLSDGVVTGDQNGNLNLDNLITRAEFAKTVNKYFGYTVKADQGFNDVSADKWYYNDMLIAKGTGYMIGDANGNANADSFITRAETFVIVARLLGLDDDNTVSFADESDIPSWAKGKIGALVKKGIISGYTDGTIKANGNITRAEAFTVVSKNERTTMPSDAPSGAATGNIGSITHGNSTPSFNNPSSGGGSGGGGGGGGGGSTSSTPIATLDLGELNIPNYKVQITAKNYAKIEFVYAVIDNNHSYTVDVTSAMQKLRDDIYSIDITPHIQHIQQSENENGKKVILKSIIATGAQGYLNATLAPEKTFIADTLRAYNVTTLKNNGINKEGELEIQWTALESSVNDYIVYVYPSNDFVNTNPVARYALNNSNATSFKIPLCKDFETFEFGKTYYIAVAAKVGNYYGVPYSDLSIPEKAGFPGGAGTDSDPYRITSALHVKNISKFPAASYILENDIDTPITEMINASFSGVLNGNGHTISIDIISEKDSLGLFREISGGTVKNLKLEGKVESTSKSEEVRKVGALASTISTAKIENCENYANVTVQVGTTSGVGGFAGSGIAGKITNSRNYGTITGNGENGGIVGRATGNIVISDCGNEGSIISIANYNTGGIIGYGENLKITKCYNTGLVKGPRRVGGIVGTLKCTGTTISRGVGVHNSYNAGKIESPTENAGLVGFLWTYATICEESPFTNNYNAGEVQSQIGLMHIHYQNAPGASMIIEGYYDTKGYKVAHTPNTAPTLKSVYLVKENPTGANDITPEGLKAITSTDSVFANSAVWAPVDANSYLEYPQLVAVPGVESYFKNLKADSYNDTNKTYTISWESKLADGTSYDVVVNGEVKLSTTSKTTAVKLEEGKKSDVSIQATVGDKTYKSCSLSVRNYTPVNLKTTYNVANEEYVLSWDGPNADGISYSVYVGNNAPIVTSQKSQVIDISLKSDVAVYVVATVDGETYKSETIKVSDNVPHNLTVQYDGENYILTWEHVLNNGNYEIYYTGIANPYTETTKSHAIVFGDSSQVEVCVKIDVDGESYYSQKVVVENTLAPYNLQVGYANKVFTLSWDCALIDAYGYDVYVDGVKVDRTTSKSMVIDLADKKTATIKVISLVSANETYDSEVTEYVNPEPYFEGEMVYSDTYCIVTWNSPVTSGTYDVYVDGVKVKSNISEKSYKIDLKGKESVEVYVVKSYQDVLYYSDTITVSSKAPKNLRFETDNGVSTLYWDCDIADATYDVYLDNEKIAEGLTNKFTTVTTEKDKFVIKVVANAGIGTLPAEKEFTALEYIGIKGSGTVEDPYIIENATHFALIKNNLDAHYKLIADIGSETEPVTSGFGIFKGSLDGNNHTVYVNLSGDAAVALFKGANNATVKNLTVAGSVTASGDKASAFFGDATGVTIINCHNLADVTTVGMYASAFVSQGSSIIMKQCSNQGAITTGSGSYAGGFIARFDGTSDTSVIEECWNNGTITSEFATGLKGLGIFIGILWSSEVGDGSLTIKNCYNTGNFVSSNPSAESLLGFNNGTRTNSKAYNIYSTVKCFANTRNAFPYENIFINGQGSTLEAIKALTTTTDGFKDAGIWTIDTSKGFKYPQLVNNPAPTAKEPFDLKTSFEDGQWVISWECILEDATYNVFVNNANIGTTTEKSFPLTGVSGVIDIYVESIKDGKTYTSDLISLDARFAGGSGTTDDPYLVGNADQFALIADNLAASYKLISDIGSEAEPVTSGFGTFTGSLDGNNHTVYVNLSGDAAVALFTGANNATVKNLTVAGSVTASGNKASAFFGDATGVTIINCHNLADVTTGGQYAAAFVSQGSSIIMKQCSNQGAITTGSGAYAGGFISRYDGTSDTSVIEECWNNGTITSELATGFKGLGIFIGVLWSSEAGDGSLTIKNCYNTGNFVSSNPSAESLLGYNNGTRTNSKAYNIYSTVKCSVHTRNAFPYENIFINGQGSTLEAIKALTTTTDGFKDADIWTIDTSNGFVYPQFVNNPAAASYLPFNLKGEFINGEFVISWESALEDATYEVYVDDVSKGTTTETSLSVSDVSGIIEIYVKSVKDGKTYTSDSISFDARFAGGSGTETDPYLIGNADQFALIAENLAANYKLIADIGSEAEPVTSGFGIFKGSLDGGNYSVYIELSGGGNVGLFSALNGATIENLKLYGTVTSTADVAGSIAAETTGVTTIKNFYNYCDITGAAYVGGVIGRGASGTNMEQCHNFGDLTALSNTGGLVGQIDNPSIKWCSNHGTITSTAAASSILTLGGLIGRLNKGSNGSVVTIEECYNAGDIITDTGKRVGGLIAIIWGNYTNTVKIKNCYTTGNIVSSNSEAGSIIGRNDSATAADDVVEGCYSLCSKYAGISKFGTQNDVYVIDNNGVTADDIKALTTTVDAFMDSDVWVMIDGFDYPQLVNNPMPLANNQ